MKDKKIEKNFCLLNKTDKEINEIFKEIKYDYVNRLFEITEKEDEEIETLIYNIQNYQNVSKDLKRLINYIKSENFKMEISTFSTEENIKINDNYITLEEMINEEIKEEETKKIFEDKVEKEAKKILKDFLYKKEPLQIEDYIFEIKTMPLIIITILSMLLISCIGFILIGLFFAIPFFTIFFLTNRLTKNIRNFFI